VLPKVFLSRTLRQVLLVLGVLACLVLPGCSRDPKVLREQCVTNGNKYFRNGRYKQASILYRRALQFDPKYAEAHYRLGLTEMQLKDYSTAAHSLQRATELDPLNEDAAIRLAEIYVAAYIANPELNKRLFSDAKLSVARILSRNPTSYDALRLSADIATASGDRETAIQRLRDVNALKPWDPDNTLALMRILVAANQAQEAERIGQELISRNKSVGQAYDLLYYLEMRHGQFDKAEGMLKTKIANLPSDGLARLELAAFYYARGRRREMLAMLDGLRSDRKTFPQADALVGDFYFRIGELDSAIQTYREGEKNQPKLSGMFDKRIAETLLMQGHYDQAIQLAAKLHNDNPKDVEAAALHASLLARGTPQQVQSAIAELEALVEKQPGNPILQMSLGRAYLLKGDPHSMDKAKQHFEIAVGLDRNSVPAKQGLADAQLARGQNREAVQIAEDLLRLSPGNVMAQLTQSTAWAKMGEIAKAREGFKGILHYHPDVKEARFRLASIDFAEKHYADAEAGFLELLRAGDSRGINGVAKCKDAQGQPAAAVQLLQRELAKFPGRLDLRVALLDIEYRSGRLQDALAELLQLAGKNPDSFELQMRLGDVQNRLGDKSSATQSFGNAHRLKPQDLNAALNFAIMLDSTGKVEQARGVYEEVLRIDPENPLALNNLAYIKADEGVDLDVALGYAQRALRHSPNDPGISDTLGLIYIRKKLTGQAVQVLRDLVNREPANPSFHMHLGMALYDAGEKQQAKKELEAALKHKPSPTEQAKIKDLVARIG
jgi:tetratricopeptide (TPR) repeat protein